MKQSKVHAERLRELNAEIERLRLQIWPANRTPDAELGMVEAYLLTAYDCIAAAATTLAEGVTDRGFGK